MRERERERERGTERDREKEIKMAIGLMEVLLVNAKGLGDTDFFGIIYVNFAFTLLLYIYVIPNFQALYIYF